MPDPAITTLLTFRVRTPLRKSDALNLRDQMIDALMPLGLRPEEIQDTFVRLMLNRSDAARLAGVPEQRTDDDGGGT